MLLPSKLPLALPLGRVLPPTSHPNPRRRRPTNDTSSSFTANPAYKHHIESDRGGEGSSQRYPRDHKHHQSPIAITMPIDINSLRTYKGGDPDAYRLYMTQRYKDPTLGAFGRGRARVAVPVENSIFCE